MFSTKCVMLLLLWHLSRTHGSADPSAAPRDFVVSIGGIFGTNSTASEFQKIVKGLPPTAGVSFRSTATLMDAKPLATLLAVSNQLISQHEVCAIVMSESGSDLVSSTAIAYAFGARLPIIGISSRQSALSDKGVFPSFLRVVPPNSHQADVWVRLLCRLQWRSTPPRIVFIHSADPEGRAALGRFQAATASPCPTTHRRHPPDPWTGLEDADGQLQTKAVIEFQPGLNSLEGELRGLKGSPAKVYILYSSQADAEVIFQDAAQLTTAEGVVWLVSESALGAKNVPVGALGLRLVGATDESYYLTDAVSVVTTALGNGDIAEDCLRSAESEESGPRLFR